MDSRQASAVTEPDDWQTVQPDDWQTVNPAPSPKPLAPLDVTPDQANDMFKAGVHSKMLGVTPGVAYEGREEIDRIMGRGYDDGKLDPTLYNDLAVGLEGSISGLYHRGKMPAELRNPGMIDNFIKGIGQMIGDAPGILVGAGAGALAGGLAGSEAPIVGNITGAGLGGAVGAFAVPDAVRKALVEGIRNGGVKNIGDLLHRAAAIAWAGAKGGAVGAASAFTGEIPVAGAVSKIPLGSTAVKGMYQAAAMTTTADLLEGRMPTAGDFAGNAALLVPLNLITHGIGMSHGEAEDALMDVYGKDGKPPQQQAETLQAQPTVKPDLPEGLRPAIQMGEGVIEGDTTDSHAELAERTLATKSVTMERLEAEPALADDVLQNPKIQEQEVIDRAWQLKKEALEAGQGVAPEAKTYQQVQDEIDALENKLEEKGERAFYFPGSEILAGTTNTRGIPYEPIPEELNRLYEERDAIGSGQLRESVNEIVGGLNKAGITDEGEVRHVLEYYALDPNRTDVFKQYMASEHTQAMVDQPVQEQLRQAYIALASERDIPMDDYDDLYRDAKTTGDAKKAVKAIQDYFYREANKGELPAPKPVTIDDLYDRGQMKSGRGFTTPEGQFLSRMEARKWMKDNEPDVHEMWLEGQNGDKQAELHSEDYAAARYRVQNRNVASGEPDYDALGPDLTKFLADARSEGGILNKIKAGLASKKYGYEAIRTLLVGPRDMWRAEGEQFVSRWRKLVPDEVDAEALHFVRDYRGEPDELRSQIEEARESSSEELKKHIPAMERALEPLSPEMQQVDDEMTQYAKIQLERGRQLGTLESGVDPSRYSPRMLLKLKEGEATGGVARPRFTERTVNSIRRDYIHALDPLISGDTQARTFNAIDEFSIYSDRMAIANSTKIFKTELKNSALGVEGSRDKVPAGWVPLSREFEERRTIVQPNKETVTTVKNFYVPKDIEEAIGPMFEQPGRRGSQLAKFLHIQSVIKGVELTLSVFHMKALGFTAFNNLGLRDFFSAWHEDSNAPEAETIERRAALYGMTTTKTSAPFEAYKSLRPEETPTGLARLKDNFVVEKVDKFAQGITHATFDVIQRKWKVMDFAKKEAGWIANHPDATEAEYGAAMRGFAKQINAAYGGLNWDVMGVSKGTQNVYRMFLLAPDWTFSNVANLKYAVSDGGTAGASSRAFFAKAFVTGFAATAAASIFIGGKYDPTDVKHLDQVYLGTDKDGKEMYANWFFVGAPKEAMNLVKRVYTAGPIAGVAETMLNKFSPVLGTVVDVAKNKDYKGAPIYKQADSTTEKTLEAGKYAGEKLVPITGVSTAKTIEDALSDPEHDYSYKDILEFAADVAGSPTYHQGSKATTGSLSSAQRFNAARGGSKNRFTIRGKR